MGDVNQPAEKVRLLDEPVSMANEMAALLHLVSTLEMLPPHLNDKAASLYRRWAARYDGQAGGLDS